MDPLSLRLAVRTALLQRAGLRPDAQSIAAATAATCRVLEAQLAPVIGTHGLEVLFRRVLHKTRDDFPFLGQAAADSSDAPLSTLPRLTSRLAAQPTEAATDAGTEFLARFTELLTTFIGAPLTDRLLAPLWGDSAASSIRRADHG